METRKLISLIIGGFMIILIIFVISLSLDLEGNYSMVIDGNVIRYGNLSDNKVINPESNDNVTLKYFWSAYCGFCKKEEPILQKFLRKHPKLNFVRIDVNKKESQSEIERYRVKGTPTFVLIRSNVTKIVAGYLTDKGLNGFLCSLLQDEVCLSENQLK